MNNGELIQRYIEARSNEGKWRERRLELRSVILAKAKQNNGRLFSRIGLALIRLVPHRHYNVQKMRELILMGRVKEEQIEPAYEEKMIEKLEVAGVVEVDWDPELAETA